jgi:CheY-like chemotaxis protein/anti-sigma regulatory factor (Ser/Thr protein kinase)
MATVLVVDDSAVDRRLVAGLLKQANLQVELAENGKDALKCVRSMPVDLVVTDLQMPELDGLGLVRHIRDHGPYMPVILITAHGSEDLAIEALHAGAASYVPKSELAVSLAQVVDEVLALTREDRNYERLNKCQTRAEFTFLLENDTALIDPIVELVQQVITSLGLCDTTGKLRTGMALQQALTNSVVHGNLELTTEQVQDAREALVTGRGRGLLAERQNQAPYRDRRVFVDVRIDREQARFVVRDEGPGFDANQFRQDGHSDAELKRGRGIRLMRMFMDELTYNDQGNEVVMVKRREQRK